MEARICETLRRQGVPHEHGSLRFRVRMPSGETQEFRPHIVARRGPILFLLEPVGKDAGKARMDLLSRFLEQHSPEIVLVVVADGVRLGDLPPGAYDEAYATADLPTLVRRIRLQDPHGMVPPFRKPGPGTGL